MTRDPSWAFGAEVIGNNFGVKKVDDGHISDATRCLVLVYGGTLAKSKVHEFVKRAILNHPNFQGSNTFRHPSLPIHAVQRFFNCQTTITKNRRRNFWDFPPICVDFPIDNVMAWDCWRVHATGVFSERCTELWKMIATSFYSIVELNFVGFIRINAQNHVLSTHEVELRSLVLESSYTEDVANPVPIKSCISSFIIN